MNNAKIKATPILKQDTYINASRHTNIDDKKVSFSFADFQTNSIQIDNFNNHYFNEESSRNAVSDFFNIIISISNLNYKELFSIATKKEYHLNKLDDDKIINRIEKVLLNGYHFPTEKIEEYESEYFEFQISDGKRVICYKIDNVIFPLFIDCNHMICIESSRNPKAKQGYKYPSSFAKLNEKELSLEEKNINDFLKIIIEEHTYNNNLTSNDIIDMLKELIK